MASKKPKEEEKMKKSSSSGKEAKPLKTPDKKTGTPKKQSNSKPKSDNKNNRSRNGTVDESEDPVDLSSSTESEESEPEREEERSMKTKNQRNKSPKPKKRKQKGGEEEEDDDDEQKEEAKLCRFPMNRIKRIIKSGDCNKGITQDAIFLVNKATEKFLERFCEDAYHFTVKDRRKSLGYKHLSSVVSKQKRYEFISDFVPEKVKAEDALKEMKLSENKLG
ncbi:hypothetical protein SLE2022_352770 [Rubroshorea leprosula]